MSNTAFKIENLASVDIVGLHNILQKFSSVSERLHYLETINTQYYLPIEKILTTVSPVSYTHLTLPTTSRV